MKILLIAYYYPPINTGGTTRPLKMAKYLEQFGHDVTVLTHTYEKTRFTEPGIIRIKDISNNKNRRGVKRFSWFLLRIYTEILNRLGIYHSIYSWWKRKVLKNRDKIMEIAKPDMIIATYPPVETLEIGLSLSKKCNIPLISDFRDGLLFEPIEEKRINQYPCIKKTYRSIEKAAVEHSSAVITITSVITD
jgi:glycosyltransferase involved in cell wall biosynthesis